MRRRPSLNAERLEDRAQPSVFGTPWPRADRLTVSFAPDGARVAGAGQDILGTGQPSALFAEMDAAAPIGVWQEEVLRAFQTWAVNTNVNLGVVYDAGGPFGPDESAPGAAPRGDVRVGAFATSPEVIAIGQSYNVVSPAWAGTVLFNASKDFSVGAAAGQYDLFTVALHEAGNVLGLPDGTDPASALYGSYLGGRGGLGPSDVAAVQALYGGPRTPDAYEGSGGNQTAATARTLTPVPSPADPSRYQAAANKADLTTPADVDYYAFTTRADTTALVVRLEAAGKSLLAAKVGVYDDQGNEVASGAAGGPTSGQDVVLAVPGAGAGRTYTVRVEKARDDVFGVGRYDLKVGFNLDPVGQSPPDEAPVYVGDAGANESIGAATPLAALNGSANSRYRYYGALADAADVDFYRLTSPVSTSKPMTVVLRPAVPFGLYAKVTAYSPNGAVAPAVVVSSGADGHVAVQLLNPAPSSTYYVKVESVGRNGAGFAGGYELTVDFRLPPTVGRDVTSGTLTDARRADAVTMTVPESSVLNLTLEAASADPSVPSGLRATVYDAARRPVATLTADAGRASSGTVVLPAGTYYVRFSAASRDGAPLPTLAFRLRGLRLSDPIDPYPPDDPTLPPPPAPDFTTIDQGDLFYDWLGLTDPWLDPWQ